MKAPLSWLKDYVDIDVSAQELQQKLFSCGFEVEELVYVGAEIDRCVVGRIEKLERHPDADKLQICRINCGSYGEDIQIVTGATNVFEGALVPVALDNSSLHGGVKIKKGKLRGVESCGMLCSGEELGINDDWYDGADVNGILILQGDIPARHRHQKGRRAGRLHLRHRRHLQPPRLPEHLRHRARGRRGAAQSPWSPSR